MNMKKTFCRMLALFLVIVMSSSLCMFSYAAPSSQGGHNVAPGVRYDKYSIKGVTTQPCTVLEFNPATSDYIPMAFSGYAGTSGKLTTQYNIATQKYGYDVAGVVNGAFFSMGSPYGTLCGNVISNGKIASAHIGVDEATVAFGSDGKMRICQSKLKYTITINGHTASDMIHYINKTHGTGEWTDRFYYYDTSCGSIADTNENTKGTEILCQKLDHTDLAVGQTLVGKVLRIDKNSAKGVLEDDRNVESDKFILFMKNGSTNEYMIDGLAVGSQVKIRTDETIPESKEIMENANSTIPNVGWLVKDGVDRTHIDANIGTHSVTLQARWTAFGTKPDGSYVFFTSEGGSTGSGGLCLRDVAKTMIDLGCNNVIRMDGGGSSAMYVKNAGSGSPGFVQSSSRAVGDCILIVKRQSMQKASVKQALNTAIVNAETENETLNMPSLTNAITKARNVYNSSESVSGDYKREIMNLAKNTTARGMLDNMITIAQNINANEYSDRALDIIDICTVEGTRMLASADTADAEMIALSEKLGEALSDKRKNAYRISMGKGYVTSQDASSSYPDNGIRELTDGTLYTGYPSNPELAGYHKGKENYVDVKIDLESSRDITGVSVTAFSAPSWGITAPADIEVYASNDGNEYYLYSKLAPMYNTGFENQTVGYFSNDSETVSARYILFRAYYASNFIFLGETSVYGTDTVNSTALTGFDRDIKTDYAVIYTPSFGTLNADNSGTSWSHLYICNKNAQEGVYTVTQTQFHSGNHDYQVTVPQDGIVIALHGNADRNFCQTTAVGDVVCLEGIDVLRRTQTPGARISFISPNRNTVVYGTPVFAEMKSDSELTIEGTLISLPRRDMTFADIRNAFLDPRVEIDSNTIGTGVNVTIPATGKTYTLYLKGDVSGDGKVGTADYLIVKRMALGTYEDSAAQNAAASCISGNTTLETEDYLRIKRHVLGTFDIYA